MENIISKTFIHYLLNLGIIDLNSAKNILSTFNDITNKNKNIDFQNAMCASLIFYFSNLDDNQKRNISFNLILKFFENTINQKLISLLSLFNLKASKNKFNLLKYFYKWKKNSKKLVLNLSNDYIPSKRKNFKNYRSKSINLSKNSNSKSNITNYNKNIYNNNNKNNNNTNTNNLTNNKSNMSISKKTNSVSNKNLILESSLDKKNREDLEHCTFTPSINHSNLYTNTNESVYQRLYKDGEKYKSKRQMRIQEFEHIKSNENTFTPKKYSTPRKFQSKDKFIDRQKNYFEKKFLNQMKLITKINEDFSKNCSFSPQIYSKNTNPNNNNNNNNNIEISVFQRLYEDDIKRRNKMQENSLNSNNINNNNTYKKNTTQSNGQVDLNKIEELYNQYKYKNLNLLNLQRKYDDEEGITFQPTINKNPIYENKLYGSNFYERNLKTLDTKNKFIENYETLEKERFRQNQIYNKKYTK